MSNAVMSSVGLVTATVDVRPWRHHCDVCGMNDSAQHMSSLVPVSRNDVEDFFPDLLDALGNKTYLVVRQCAFGMRLEAGGPAGDRSVT